MLLHRAENKDTWHHGIISHYSYTAVELATMLEPRGPLVFCKLVRW